MHTVKYAVPSHMTVTRRIRVYTNTIMCKPRKKYLLGALAAFSFLTAGYFNFSLSGPLDNIIHEPTQSQQSQQDSFDPKSHIYHSNGLIQADPSGSHPIFELFRRAEHGWAKKLRSASTTLDQAVREYRRRYNRDPPKGFDDW
jgi:hypothetical protein